MKPYLSNITFTAVISLIFIFLTACGGGGGDTPSIEYTGLTTPADIDASNALPIAVGALAIGGLGLEDNLVAQAADNGTQGKTSLTIITQAVMAAIIENKVELHGQQIGAVDSGSEAGNCGGSLSYSLNYGEVYPVPFDGSFTFNNYCEDGIVINTSLLITEGMGYETYIVFSMGTEVLLIKDNADSRVYKGEAFYADITAYYYDTIVTDLSLKSSGRFYHPDYGYVDFTTPEPMYYIFDDPDGSNEWPISGSMQIVEAGIPLPSRLVITALENAQYQLQLDLDGDGVYEDETTGNWSDL